MRNLSKNFKEEEKSLRLRGINSWDSLMNLKDHEINEIIKTSRSTNRNLKRLRCIAMLIHEIDLSQGEAALLMHSGICSSKALINLTPQELLNKTGRFERQLRTGRDPLVDLQKANSWIKRAKARQINN